MFLVAICKNLGSQIEKIKVIHTCGFQVPSNKQREVSSPSLFLTGVGVGVGAQNAEQRHFSANRKNSGSLLIMLPHRPQVPGSLNWEKYIYRK